MTEPEQGPPATTKGPDLTAGHARELLGSMPRRPRRRLGASDHIWVGTTAIFAMASGLVALAGNPWWAIIPGVTSSIGAFTWLAHRQAQVNEPRLRAVLVPSLFAVWLSLPIWRGITRGDTIPFPESLIFAGLAPAAWLGLYLWILLRR
ncbi:hypothetical protein FEF26_04205 [Nesterenkonia salmonea]|uniref:DUF3054 domain-containing protein n=1 Tax=Nesterenkonia salmonea TaxID=1804987 RepID=A0A5R9BDA2_9MICC|nr:hypothetical protein [Nesterenkonia salmonea]TLP98607.1 hypothetical protein FEF26_04205 [Nesterenkonia salmonea]